MQIWNDLNASRKAIAAFAAVGIGWASFSAQMPVIKTQVGVGDGLWGTLLLLGSTGALMAMWLAPLFYRILGTWALLVSVMVMIVGFMLTGIAEGPIFIGIALFMAAAGSGIADVQANNEVSEDYRKKIDELNDDLVTLYLKELRLLEIGRFREGLAAVKDHKGWYFIDVRGKAITKERFHNVLNFEDGKARVSKGDEGWYIDRTGRRTDFIQIVQKSKKTNND